MIARKSVLQLTGFRLETSYSIAQTGFHVENHAPLLLVWERDLALCDWIERLCEAGLESFCSALYWVLQADLSGHTRL